MGTAADQDCFALTVRVVLSNSVFLHYSCWKRHSFQAGGEVRTLLCHKKPVCCRERLSGLVTALSQLVLNWTMSALAKEGLS